MSLFEKCEKKDRNIVKYYISKFPDLFNFCKKDLGKVALLLRKGVIGHEYIDSWEKWEEKSSQSKLSPSDWNYKHAQRVRNACKLEEVKEYVRLYNMQDALTSCLLI